MGVFGGTHGSREVLVPCSVGETWASLRDAVSAHPTVTGATFNDNDNIFEDSMLMRVTADGDGYLGAMVFGADSDRDGA